MTDRVVLVVTGVLAVALIIGVVMWLSGAIPKQRRGRAGK